MGRLLIAPYSPALQLVQLLAPAKLYVPATHDGGDPVPAGQKYPAGHCAVHIDDGSADVAPYRPAGHAVHTPLPDTLYCPAAHAAAVAFVDPTTHA